MSKKEVRDEENVELEFDDVQSNENVVDYVYFVSYYHSRGFGSAEVTLSGVIESIEQIGDIQSLIEQEYELKGVQVINFQPLRAVERE